MEAAVLGYRHPGQPTQEQCMIRQPRRMVTGHDRTGRSIVAIDTRITPLPIIGAVGAEFFEIRNTAGTRLSLAECFAQK
jgi:hypothetical protein